MDYEDHVFTNNNNNKPQNNNYDPPPNPYYRQPPPNYYYQPPPNYYHQPSPNYYHQPSPNYYHQPSPTQQYQNYGMQNLTPNTPSYQLPNNNQQSIPIDPKLNFNYIDLFSNSEKNPPKNETIPKSNQTESQFIIIPQSNQNQVSDKVANITQSEIIDNYSELLEDKKLRNIGYPTNVIEDDDKKDISVEIKNDENLEVIDENPVVIEEKKDKKTKEIKFHKNVMEDIKKKY